MDPHWFGSLDPDPDPHRDKMPDPYTPGTNAPQNAELFSLFFLHHIILISGVPSLLTTSAARLSGEDMNANQSL
jgi:hypothetical protein